MATEALVLEERARAETRPATGGRILELRRHRVELGGVSIDRVDLPAAVERIRGFLRAGTPHQIMTVNLDFLSIAERDASFQETINNADLAVADGMPLVWASRLRGEPLAERITGVELVDETCRLAVEEGHGVFLLGAADGIAEAAARELERRYPGLRVVGVYAPPFGPMSAEEDANVVAMIKDAAPGVLFVALGAPRQDLWIREHLHRIGVPVAMGVGCVFDLLAGRASRAPAWMQRAGLEWSYRLVQEPGRLWRRYVLDDMPTFGRLVMGTMRSARGIGLLPAEPMVERPV
jgi:N-acetylglucosaminyldiphosphoundecaprenol N-acetyl-beta-D-mannosaminyltransferase